PPSGQSNIYLVSEISNSWPIRQDKIAVDPYTGGNVARLNFADYPLPAKLTTLGIDAHSGTLFGLANQLLLIAFASGVLFVIGAGYRMWWLRRPKGSLMGKTPTRIAWQRFPRSALVTGGLVIIGIGVMLPVLGVSLVLFIMFDYLLSLHLRGKESVGDRFNRTRQA
ncbi:MAG: PepSY domain-containing protein, partial [Candidatus Dormibacteraceae bacterium]